MMSGGRVSDADLLAAARRSPEAFGRFYDRYEQAVVSYFMRRVGAPDVAADLTAEVFARVLESAHRYRAEQPTAAAWLFTIAHNTLVKSIRQGQVEAADLTLSHELSPRAHRPGPDDVWDEFDAAVLRLGLAMESESIAGVQATMEALSVTMSRLADRLDGEIGPYPWYKSHGSEPAAPQRTEPVDDAPGAEASVS